MFVLSIWLVLASWAFLSVSASSNYAIGWTVEGKTAKDYILDVDYDNMTINPLFPIPIHYINSLGSAYDQVHQVIFLMAETAINSNKFGFFTIDLTTNSTKTYNLPAALLPFESTLRWISTTPDVVYIFSWKAAYTFTYSTGSFQQFLNFSITFENIIPENAQSPTPYYFDTNANILYCYFVYYGSNNKVEITRLGVTMAGAVQSQESVKCIPGHVPYFDSATGTTYSMLSISTGDFYNYVQTVTQGGACTDSKSIFASPTQMECYLWDAANERMLLSNFNFTSGPLLCKYTDQVWNMTCEAVAFQLEDIYTISE